MSVESLDKLICLHADGAGNFSATLKASNLGVDDGVLYGVDRVEELVIVEDDRAVLVARGKALDDEGATVVGRIPHVICAPILEVSYPVGTRLIMNGRITHSALKQLLLPEKPVEDPK